MKQTLVAIAILLSLFTFASPTPLKIKIKFAKVQVGQCSYNYNEIVTSHAYAIQNAPATAFNLTDYGITEYTEVYDNGEVRRKYCFVIRYQVP